MISEGQCHDRQIVAAQPQDREPENHAPEGGEDAGHRQTHPEGQPEGAGQKRVGIGAYRVEGDVTEIEQAGEADDDVQAPGEHHVDEDLDAEVIDPLQRSLGTEDRHDDDRVENQSGHREHREVRGDENAEHIEQAGKRIDDRKSANDGRIGSDIIRQPTRHRDHNRRHHHGGDEERQAEESRGHAVRQHAGGRIDDLLRRQERLQIGDHQEAADHGDDDENRQQAPARHQDKLVADVLVGLEADEENEQAERDQAGIQRLAQSPRRQIPGGAFMSRGCVCHCVKLSRLRDVREYPTA